MDVPYIRIATGSQMKSMDIWNILLIQKEIVNIHILRNLGK